MRRWWTAVAVVAALSAAGCQTVPVGSMLALSRLDPFAMDPVALRAAVMHPPTLAFPDGATTLNMSVRKQGGDIIDKESFALKVGTESDPIGAPRDRSVTVFAVMPSDHDRFRLFLSGMRALREKAPGKHAFSIGVNVKPCQTVRRGDASVSTYLRTDADGRYILVSRGLDIAEEASVDLPRCAGS